MFSTATKLFLVMMSFTVFFAEKAIASCGKFVVVKGDVQIDVVKTQKFARATQFLQAKKLGLKSSWSTETNSIFHLIQK